MARPRMLGNVRASAGVLSEILRLQIWVVPAACALIAAVAALVVVWIEETSAQLGLAIGIDPVSARSLLSAVSSAMISFTGLVFTVTMLVLQLASSQLSPRVMRTFLRDRFNQAVLGLFVATFVFSLLMLATVKDDFVPQLGVVLSIALVLAAVFAFVAYIDHMAHAIRPTSVIGAISEETRSAIDRNYPALEDESDEPPSDRGREAVGEDEPRHTVRWTQPSGYVQSIHEERMLDYAREHGLTVELLAAIGDYVVRDGPVLEIIGGAGDTGSVSDSDLDEAVRVGPERTMSQDPEFGFRQLVDVALRALSPSLNDPTTANEVIDAIHDLLRHLLRRRVDSTRVVQLDGRAGLIVPAPDWDAFVRAAVDEIHAASSGLPQVRSHLRSMLVALADDAAPERLPAIRLALDRFDSTALAAEAD